MVDPSDRQFCFVHAADLHLDTPFSGLRAASPPVAAALREASLDAFDAIVELALERRAAFLLVAGDVYDGAERGVRAQLRFRGGLARLAAAGIPSFVVHGNHDPLGTGWSAVREWPAGVTIFGSDQVAVVPVERDGELLATVQGISYARRDTSENLARRFSRPEGAGFHVGLLHANVQGAGEGHANYSPCTLDDLRAARLDYWALGHVHTRQVLALGAGPGDPTVVYPGNSQARSPRPSERGAKGAVVVQVAAGRVAEVEPVACDAVRFDEVTVSIDGAPGIDAVEDRLLEAADRALESAGGRSLVLRARLVGRGDAHEPLARARALEELLVHLRDASSAAAPFTWWDAVEDATGAPIDLDELRRRGDFAADLVAHADSIAGDPDRERALASELLAALPRTLARSASSIVDDSARLDRLLGAARDLALDALDALGGAS